MTTRSPARPRPRLILVDDDPAVGDSLKFLFELEGFDVETHADAGSLLAASPGTGPGCLVIDQRLPDMSGLDLLARLRKAGVRLPALLITSNPDARLRARARDRRVVIVEKPLLDNALLEAVRTALEPA
jgi:FixJ family two-component response regulator